MAEKFPEMLRAARESKGLSQSELADRAGLQPSAVSPGWERPISGPAFFRPGPSRLPHGAGAIPAISPWDSDDSELDAGAAQPYED